MAKYTQLLSEYLADGGTLPAIFDTIPDFENLFVGHYIDKEIGFETPYLFSIKLETKANLVVPAYAERINLLKESLIKLNNPTKTFDETYGRTFDGGKQESKITNLPLNASTSTPNSISENDPYQDEESSNRTRTESGENTSEIIAKIETLKNKITTLEQHLLEEFSNLFMKVY